MSWWEKRSRLATGYRAVWRRGEGLQRISTIGLTVVFLHLLAVVTVGQSGVPGAIAVPIAAVLGPAGAWGVAIGAALGTLITSGHGVRGVFTFLGVFAAGVLGRALWLLLAYPYRRRPGTGVLAIVPVAIVGTAAGTGIAIVGTAIFSQVEFAAHFPALVVDQLLITVVLGPLIVVAASPWSDVPVTGMTISARRWLTSVAIVGAVTLVWLVGAFLLDTFRTDIRGRPELREELAEQLPPVIDVFVVFVSGRWGWILQLLMATLALWLVVATIVLVHSGPNEFPRFRSNSELDR